MADGPIFLAGVDRTGIGLLGELLEAHPEVAITRRTNFWDFYAGRYGDLSDPDRLDRCVADMMRYTRIRRLDPDPERLKAELARGEATYPRLFRLLQEQNLERLGKTRWGDKSQGSERHAETILAAYPDATMVLVVRDPRDRYASRATHRSAGRGGVGSGTAEWRWSTARARTLAAAYPERFRAVRYEDLVTRPEETLRSLCALMGLDDPDALLAAGPGPLHRGSVGRFRRDLTVGEIRFIERFARRGMARWGYRPSRPTWPRRDRIRSLATEWPVAVAGMVLWRPWSWLRGRLGGPSARRLAR